MMGLKPKLPLPLHPWLDDAPDEAAVRRVWDGIESRRALKHARLSLGWTRGLALGTAAAAALGLVAAGLYGNVGPDVASTGPLHVRDGSPVTAMVAARGTGQRVVLSDGSAIQVSGGSLDVLENSSQSVSLALRRGRARFDVKPGGPRQWKIDCGEVSVEVVGTSFVVDRSSRQVRVRVARGTVIVRGSGVPSGVQRLGAGGDLRVAVTDPRSVETPVRQASIGEETPSPSPGHPADRAGSSSRIPWRVAAQGGDYRSAYARLGSRGIVQHAEGASSIEDLMELADVARLSGHPAEAVAPLQQAVSRFPSDRRAALAAFALGRVYVNSLHAPRRAAAAFEQAIALGLPEALVDDASARVVDSHRRAGDHGSARAAADRYLQRFPGGRHRAAVEDWAADGATSPE